MRGSEFRIPISRQSPIPKVRESSILNFCHSSIVRPQLRGVGTHLLHTGSLQDVRPNLVCTRCTCPKRSLHLFYTLCACCVPLALVAHPLHIVHSPAEANMRWTVVHPWRLVASGVRWGARVGLCQNESPRWIGQHILKPGGHHMFHLTLFYSRCTCPEHSLHLLCLLCTRCTCCAPSPFVQTPVAADVS